LSAHCKQSLIETDFLITIFISIAKLMNGIQLIMESYFTETMVLLKRLVQHLLSPYMQS